MSTKVPTLPDASSGRKVSQLHLLSPALIALTLGIGLVFFGQPLLGGFLTLAALVATGLAYRVAQAEFRAQRSTDEDASPMQLAFVDPLIHPYLVELVLRAINAPQSVTGRIKQSVTPLSRAMEVKTQYTMQIPAPLGRVAGDKNGISVYLPIVRARKGVLHDALFVTHQGVELPTLTFEQGISLVGSCMRALVGLHHPDRMSEYRLVEPFVLQALSSRAKSDAAKETNFETLKKALTQVLPDGFPREQILATTQRLSRDYFIFGVVTLMDLDQPNWLHFQTTERKILTHQLAAEQPSHRDRLVAWWRTRFGVRSSRIDFPIDFAYLSGSFHLEVLGPPKTYLARHTYTPEASSLGHAPAKPLSGYRRLRSRRGQRYLHFYARSLDIGQDIASSESGSDDFKPKVSAWFYERPPGSSAASAVAALVAAVLVTSAGRVAASGETRSDIVAVLLAAPAIVAGWSGFDRGDSPIGGTLSARVTSLVTLILCVGASAQYLVGSRPEALITAVSGGTAWKVLGTAATVNALSASYSWMKRARLYDLALRKLGPDETKLK